MTVASPGASTALLSSDAEEMAEFGILRVPVDSFHYREFRYTHLVDALAQAKRDQASKRLGFLR
jgi:hypothetical protein